MFIGVKFGLYPPVIYILFFTVAALARKVPFAILGVALVGAQLLLTGMKRLVESLMTKFLYPPATYMSDAVLLLIAPVAEPYLAMKDGHNQYAPMQGLIGLRERIAQKMSDRYTAVYNPETEITITAGGTQAIYTAIAAVVHEGDEVIILSAVNNALANVSAPPI